MQELGRHLMTLITGTLLCGILLSMVHDGVHAKLIRFSSGLFLALLLFYPLSRMDLLADWEDFRDVFMEAEQLAAYGEDMAVEEKTKVITEQLETYILDKASTLGADLAVTIALDANSLPTQVRLQGEITEQAKQELSEILQTDLGISKENQQWIG